MLQDSWGQPVEDCGTHPLSPPAFTGSSIVRAPPMWSSCVRFARTKHGRVRLQTPSPRPETGATASTDTGVQRERRLHTGAPA